MTGEIETEDLIPSEVIVGAIDRWMRNAENSFEDTYKPNSPIVPQIEAWAKANKLTLETPSWKVELAKRVKQRMLGMDRSKFSSSLDTWDRLFSAIST
jgi:hypothetical protein